MLINADSLDTSPPEEAVQGLLPRVGQGFVYGPRHWGKSLLIAQELALDVASGAKFLGRDTVQGSVALCLGEGLYDAGVRKQGRLVREQQDRAARAAAMGADGPAWLAAQPPYSDEWLFVMTEPFELPIATGNEYSESMRAAVQQLRKLPDLALVILDSFNDFTGNLSISHNTSANRAMQGMKALVRELDCCVVAVAHPTEKGDKMLGAGRLGNAADFIIAIRPDEDAGPDDPKTATVTSEKNKAGPPFEPFSYVIEPVAWHEPARDPETGAELAGEPPQLVTSATVRLREDDQARGGGLRLPGTRPRPALALPQAVPLDPPKRKRNGIRILRPADTPDPALAELNARLVSGYCPDCGEGMPGKSCNPGVPGEQGLVMLGRRPLLVAHVSRIWVQIAAGKVTGDEARSHPGAGDALDREPAAMPA